MSRQHYVRPLRLTDEAHKQTVRCACGEHKPGFPRLVDVYPTGSSTYPVPMVQVCCRHCGKVLGAEQAQGGAR